MKFLCSRPKEIVIIVMVFLLTGFWTPTHFINIMVP